MAVADMESIIRTEMTSDLGLEPVIAALHDQLDADLVAIVLYGSRARAVITMQAAIGIYS